ncbi:MAG: ribosome assembly cofactor RimP [Winogradskyella sp.]
MNTREDEKSSLFILEMFKKIVEDLLQNALDERPDLFLIDFTISPENAIKIVLDGDNGVLVEDCMFVSRAIEHNMDREEQDFSLQVLSSGATSPLLMPRQYKRHVGRNLQVKTNEGDKIEGELASADEESVLLKWKTREPKPVGKGKVTVTKEASIAYSDIKEAKVKIKF